MVGTMASISPRRSASSGPTDPGTPSTWPIRVRGAMSAVAAAVTSRAAPP